MTWRTRNRALLRVSISLAFLTILCKWPGGVAAAPTNSKVRVVPRWSRFEQPFKSSTGYSNPVQEATLNVTLTSPSGEQREIYGFWDGGKTWRFRFLPDEVGTWKYQTRCSDTSNRGLHDQRGEFLCTASTELTPFNRHGPVHIAADHRHLEHADGAAFFWLSDTVWDGARVSAPNDWGYYSGVRAIQRFTVSLWAVAPGVDQKGAGPFTGKDRISVLPEFFKRLDTKLDTLRHAGLLNAIAPLVELGLDSDAASTLPEDQAILLLRYAVARWQGDPVVWVVAFEADKSGKRASRWKRIGQAVFGNQPHAPVMVFPGRTQWTMDEFRQEKWVDLFGCAAVTDVTEDALKRTFSDPASKEWNEAPARPIIQFLPPENSLGSPANHRLSGDDVRKSAYWSLLISPPAGIGYSAQGVSSWDQTIAAGDDKSASASLPLWRRSLFLPGAKQMGWVTDIFSTMQFWRLRPARAFVAAQPGDRSPGLYISAAGSEAKDLSIFYVPEDRTVEVSLDSLPASPQVEWINPRSGQHSSAVAVIGPQSAQFPTPDPGDWVLLMKAGK